MRKIVTLIGIAFAVAVLSFFTGMYRQPWWFRFVYDFPIIMILIKITEERKEK